MMMSKGVALWLIILSVAAQLPLLLLASPLTAPAFLWSPNHDQVMEAVNYQTISSKDLAKSVLVDAGWSNLLCSENKLAQPVDLVLVFVGSAPLSSDIFADKIAEPALVNSLKAAFTISNFSMAFPYVAASEAESVENSLISGFGETCGWDSERVDNVAFSESCSIKAENFQMLADLHAVHDHMVSRAEKKADGRADLVVFCHGSNSVKGLDSPKSESQIFSDFISTAEMLGKKYAVLFVSDPSRSIRYPSERELERFLAEAAPGKGSLNHTICDEVCQIKSSLLEGVLVGIVLLIILISGLCCMMGIDTPTRFEAPQES